MLQRLMYAVLERHDLDAEVCSAEDGTPYLSVQTGEWSTIMATPDHIRGLAVILTDDMGIPVRVARHLSESRALVHLLRHI